MRHYQQNYAAAGAIEGLDDRIRAARDSIKHLLAVYRAVPASALGGNFAAYVQNNHSSPYPGGSDTGIGWTYMRYPHAASTAWAGLLLLYQFDEDDEVREDANPYAPPATAVPDPHGPGWGRHCLPAAGPAPLAGAPRGGGGACSAHPGCSGRGLSGDCCPTKEGMLLGCCSDATAPPAPPPLHVRAGAAGADGVPTHGAPGQGAPRACADNSGCAGLGLVGDCCPTAEGTMLGCC